MGEGTKLVAQNRRARHDYEILGNYEAGIVLQGTEVKSLRQGLASFQDSFARIEEGEAYLYRLHISPYDSGNRFNHDPDRRRKLLLHARELRSLIGQTEQKGLTLIPLKIYFKRGVAKVEIGLARAKRQHDRRREIAQRDVERDIDRALSGRND
ncbi:MAG: SsrA-binding protein SmpB [Candidatus Latescibacterota bacterium]|nr:SsrA-binding protein SmpB [Candidatus Latescibacterota bacterium]